MNNAIFYTHFTLIDVTYFKYFFLFSLSSQYKKLFRHAKLIDEFFV